MMRKQETQQKLWGTEVACTRCGVIKFLKRKFFYFNPTLNRFRRVCRKCDSKYFRTEKYKEKHRVLANARYKIPESKIKSDCATKVYRNLHPVQTLEMWKRKRRREVDQIRDSYLRRLLKQKSNFPNAPLPVIELKRTQIKLRRAIHEAR